MKHACVVVPFVDLAAKYTVLGAARAACWCLVAHYVVVGGMYPSAWSPCGGRCVTHSPLQKETVFLVWHNAGPV